MTSAAERLAALKEKVSLARAANTKAVEDELRQSAEQETLSERLRRKHHRYRVESKAYEKSIKNSKTLKLDERLLDQTADAAKEQRKGSGRKRKRGVNAGNTDGNSEEEDSKGEINRYSDANVLRAYEKRLKSLEKGRKDGVAGSESKDDVDRLVNELESTKRRRKMFSRRREFNEDDDDIRFINERNRKFNKKLDRNFGNSTATVRENLERGTALPDS